MAPGDVRTETGNQLAWDLVNLNCDSVARRCSHIEQMLSECREWRQPFATMKKPYSLAEMAKAAHCFLHQSCEAGCNERPLFHQVKRAVDSLPEQLFKSREYEEAAWD